MQDAARQLLMHAVIPLWIAAGLADWWCHRRTRIETTSGLAENLFHWVLLAQGGVAVLAACLLEANGFVLLLVAGVFLAHEATTFLELRYTVPRRDVRPGEQMVHSLLEILPLALLLLLAVTGWERAADFGPKWKSAPWPPAYLAGVLAAVALCNLLPMAEETRRCLRSRIPARPGST
ncbi:hypothetical protein [Ramlibacter pallidus]|uniref:Diguanylate cyclase n=1 Tax=Ramlibacter pallidus TaxID=2780087 RepID=A0ABR9S070_9BURK|nr:hypothetical protein [Ramlibacter pallidus]MBE7366873.1 hypothetical protein [Ramlibacter pallidus]